MYCILPTLPHYKFCKVRWVLHRFDSVQINHTCVVCNGEHGGNYRNAGLNIALPSEHSVPCPLLCSQEIFGADEFPRMRSVWALIEVV